MKGGGKAPPPPDPTAVSQAQTQANQQTAQYNAALGSGSIFTPLGSSQFTGRVDPTTGATVYDQRVNLTPDAQAQLDSEMAQNRQLNTVAGGMLDRIGSTYGTPMDTSTLPKMLGARISFARGWRTRASSRVVRRSRIRGTASAASAPTPMTPRAARPWSAAATSS